MKFLFISLAFLFFTYNTFLVQINTGFSSEYKVLKVKPSDADAQIKEANSPHLVVYNPAVKQGKLLFFTPGTGGIGFKNN